MDVTQQLHLQEGMLTRVLSARPRWLGQQRWPVGSQLQPCSVHPQGPQ